MNTKERESKLKKVVSIDSRYERGELIGRGGAGSVYEGVQLGMNRKVAIKILNPRSTSDAFEFRFAREARAVAQLNHPNCITIFDSGYDEILDCHYMVMELIKGQTLSCRIETGLSVGEILRFAIQILSGVQHAHSQGILHRDLKPSNVLISDDGVAKVVDFGLALMAEDVDSDRITRDGAIYGTPPYMSPEQCRGSLTIDARSDLYSFGVVLYEMLEGELPFRSENVLDILLAHTNEPAPRVTSADIPSSLADYVDKLLSKEPEERFENATEALSVLEDIKATHAIRTGVVTPMQLQQLPTSVDTLDSFEFPREIKAPKRRVMWLALAIGILTALLFSVYFSSPDTLIDQAKTDTRKAETKPKLVAELTNNKAIPAINDASRRIHDALTSSTLPKKDNDLVNKITKPEPAALSKKPKAKRQKSAVISKKIDAKDKKEKEKKPLKTIQFVF